MMDTFRRYAMKCTGKPEQADSVEDIRENSSNMPTSAGEDIPGDSPKINSSTCMTYHECAYCGGSLIKVGTTLQKDLVKHPHYILYERRLRTYENWPKQLKQTNSEMASAGFFYTGRGDRVQCYYCGLLLHRWEDEDRPVAEHVRHAPDCLYIKMKTTS